MLGWQFSELCFKELEVVRAAENQVGKMDTDCKYFHAFKDHGQSLEAYRHRREV